MFRNFGGPQTRVADTRPGGTGSRVRSPLITVLVGPEEEPFSVYKDVLCRSSVLAAMLIYPPYEDWEQNTIYLERDRPEEIQYLIEYLFSNNYQTELERNFEIGARSFEEHPPCDENDPVVWRNIVKNISKENAKKEEWPEWTSPEDSHRLCEWIADHINSKSQAKGQNRIDKRNAWNLLLALEHMGVYVLARRYDLPELQKRAYKKMIEHIDWRSSPNTVLDLAAMVYPYIQGNDDVFIPRIRKLIHKILEIISLEGMEECDKVFGHYLQYEPRFANDLTVAYHFIADKDHSNRFSSGAQSTRTSEE